MLKNYIAQMKTQMNWDILQVSFKQLKYVKKEEIINQHE